MLDYTPSPSLAFQLCQPETLHAAWRKVRANKGGPGSDGVTIQRFETDLAKHLRQLSRELTEERYYPLPVQKFTMKKENGGTRELSVLTLKDRIVQRAVCDLISPIYEAKFLDCSFGYRRRFNTLCATKERRIFAVLNFRSGIWLASLRVRIQYINRFSFVLKGNFIIVDSVITWILVS